MKPVVFLLADLGYPPYAETLVTTRNVLRDKRDALRRFVQASAEGWKSYLSNPAPGNALIKRDNPQMEDGLLAFGVRKIREYGLVAEGDARKNGLLTMTDARWQRTHEFMVGVKLLKPSVDFRQAYTLEIVKTIKVLP